MQTTNKNLNQNRKALQPTLKVYLLSPILSMNLPQQKIPKLHRDICRIFIRLTSYGMSGLNDICKQFLEVHSYMHVPHRYWFFEDEKTFIVVFTPYYTMANAVTSVRI